MIKTIMPLAVVITALTAQATVLTSFNGNSLSPDYVANDISVSDLNPVGLNFSTSGGKYHATDWQHNLPDLSVRNFSFVINPDSAMRVDGLSFNMTADHLNILGHNKMFVAIFDGSDLQDGWVASIPETGDGFHAIFNSFTTVNPVYFYFMGLPGTKFDETWTDNITVYGEPLVSPPPAVPEVNTLGLVAFGIGAVVLACSKYKNRNQIM